MGTSFWRDYTDDVVLSWLLEPSYPSIRRLALMHLLDTPAQDRQVSSACASILREPPAAEILALQRPDGSWLAEENAYAPMYKSTVWQVIFLAELAADGRDKRIQRGVEHVLDTMQHDDGSFPATWRTYHGNLICCHALVTRALLRLGYAEDERAQRAVDVLVRWSTDEGFLCRHNKGCPCSWAVVKTIRALTEAPGRSTEVETAIHRCGEFLASGDLSRGDYPTATKVSDHWFRFSFPRGYNADILEAMLGLDAAGYAGDERLRPAVDFIASQRKLLKREGQEPIYAWRSHHAITGRLLVDLDPRCRGGPSKWVTLHALMVLKDWYPGL